MRLKFALLLILSAFFISNSVLSQNNQDEVSYLRYGVFANFQYNFHEPDFVELPSVPNCCPRFTEGGGPGFALGGLYEIPLSDIFYLGARAFWAMDNGLLKKIEYTKVNLNDLPFDGELEHSIDASLHTLNLSLAGGARLFESLQLCGGIRAAYLIIHDYDQKEIIVSPDRGTFTNGARIRNNNSGAISQTNALLLFLRFGISYELSVNEAGNWFLTPELFYNIGLNDLISTDPWKINEISLGVSLKYAPPPPERRNEEYFDIDTIKIIDESYSKNSVVLGEPEYNKEVEEFEDLILTKIYMKRLDTLYMPEPDLFVKMKTKVNEAEDTLKLYLERYYTSEVFPLIPYIFFDKDETDVPARYFPGNRVEDFDKPEYDLNPLMLQRNILNVLGKRMAEYPDIVMELTGTADKKYDRGNCDIARARAENVKNYLVNAWDVSDERIIVKTAKRRCYPENPTLSNNEDGYSDNRRVEITSSDDIRLFAPIVRKRFLNEARLSSDKQQIKHPVLNHNFNGSTKDSIIRWNLTASQAARELYSMKGEGAPSNLDKPLDEQTLHDILSAEPLNLSMELVNFRNRKSRFDEILPVFVDTTDIEVERLSLSYFKVSHDTLSKKVKNEIHKLLSGAEEHTEVIVIGYTDYLGNPEENKELSANRADKVAEYIEAYMPTAKVIVNKGVSDTEYPPGIKSYSTPEERFLSRTVKIEFKTILHK